MRRAILLLGMFAFVGGVCAVGQSDIYDNGPTNGTTDAWAINMGSVTSDSFRLGAASNIGGVEFSAWLFPGDVLRSVEVSITSEEFGGTVFMDEVVTLRQGNCLSNQYGYNVCAAEGSFNRVAIPVGTWWLNLQNAVVDSGDPVYWDENGGPSSASENSVGTIPSESFTLTGGGCGAGRNSPDCGPPSTPEAGSFLLLGSGIVVMAALGRVMIR